MYLARIISDCEPLVAKVVDYELVMDAIGEYVRRPRQPRAWKIKGGAAAVSQSPSGAVASAKNILEQERLKQRVDNWPCKPKYQRTHIE